MYFAQALLFHRQGADGLQLGMASDAWRTQPWMNDLADPEKVLFADKHYMLDPVAIRPGTFALAKKGDAFTGALKAGLRIGDDVAAARAAGHGVEAALVVYCRPLAEGERLGVYVNGNGPVEISGDSAAEKARRGAKVIDPRKEKAEAFIFEKEWWRRGEHVLPVPADWWRLRDNELELVYTAKSAAVQPPLSIMWVDLLLKYRKATSGAP